MFDYEIDFFVTKIFNMSENAISAGKFCVTKLNMYSKNTPQIHVFTGFMLKLVYEK